MHCVRRSREYICEKKLMLVGIGLIHIDNSLLLTQMGKSHLKLCEVAQSLRCCATNRKVDSSIPAGVIGIFH